MMTVVATQLLWFCCFLWPVAAQHTRATAGVTLPPPPPGGLISSAPHRGVLIDEDGRERIFHGTNVVYKGHPYVPPSFPIDTTESFGEEDMDRIASWGMNNVRLGLSWAGAEPQKGKFNYTYLASLRNIVDALGSKGIYTYVELHQDALAERFCGNGIPNWAINPEMAKSFPQPLAGLKKYPVNETDGLPSEADCNGQLWANYYGSKAVGATFQSLFDDTDGIGTITNLWREVAKVFKDCTWLLGYELMNEPWAGDHWLNPSIVYPGVADRVNLAPFYKKLTTAIQEVDTDHLVMFEPVAWNNFFKSGFEESPCGSKLENKSVFAYHYYHPPDMMSPASYMGYRTADATRLLSAGFLTEFSTSWNVPDSTAPQHDLQHAKDVIAAAEKFKQSWSGWQYKVFHPSSGRHPMTPGDMSMFHPDGTLDTGMVGAVSQPYARAVAGVIVSNKFTPAKFEFCGAKYVLDYTARKSCKLPTEVYINEKVHFPHGITVTVWPPHLAVAVYNATARVVLVTHVPDITDGTVITVEIKNKIFETLV